MKRTGSHVGALASLLALAAGGCAGSLPDPGRLPSQRNTQNASVERFKQDEGDVPVLYQRTEGSSPLGEARLDQELSPQLARRPISIDFQNPDANLGDLVGALSAYDIPIAFRWTKAARGGSGGNGATASGTSTRSGSTGNDLSPRKDVVTQHGASGPGDEALQRRIPFTSYKGTVGGLFKTLRTGSGLAAWQDDGMVYLGDTDTYAVTMPQDEKAIKSMSDTLKSMGAEDITESVDGGRIVYSASPAQHDHVIGPFVRRIARNLATITIQVSIVNLALTDKSGQGFDWSKFSLAVDQRANSIAAANAAGTTSTTATTSGTSGTSVNTSGLSSGLSNSTVGTTDTTGSSSTAQKGVLSSLSSTGLTLGTTSVGKVFGVQTVASVSSAIQFLSIFGNTNITQQVSVRTLSGKEVKFSSGEEIPYVTGVGVGTLGSNGVASSNGVTNGSSGYSSNNTLGTSNTDKVKIGTDITMTPRFESENKLVTIDFKMKLASLIEFVKLDAGNQLGSLTQPHTAEQELNSMLRVKAGQTVVLGGLQKDSEQYNGSEPTALRDELRDDQVALGSRAQDVSRNALFVILRPTVTVYEPEEGR